MPCGTNNPTNRGLGFAAVCASAGKSGAADGLPLQGASLLRFDGGRTAVRLDYGTVTVWSYDQAVPPQLRSGVFSPSKVLTDEDGNVIHFYELAGGGLAAERDLGPVTVAVVAPEAEKFDVIALLADARLR